MSYKLLGAYIPIPTIQLAPLRPIDQGEESVTTGKYGVADVVTNTHWCHAHHTPILIASDCKPASTGYSTTSTSYIQFASFRRSVLTDFSTLTCAVNVTGTGTVKLELGSDPSGYVALIGFSGVTALTHINTLTQNVGVDDDTIRVSMKATSGTVKLHSITIRPTPLASIAAGKSASGVYPIATDQTDQDSPYSVEMVQDMIDSLEAIRKTRTDTIVSYAGDFSRTADFTERGTAHVPKLYIPFFARHGQTKIRYNLYGYRAAGSGSYEVRIRTGHMIAKGTKIDVGLPLGPWAAPYESPGLVSTGTDLDCEPNAPGYIEVSMTSDGVNLAYLYGITAFFAEATE